jgi:hypothetical protein
MYSNSNRPTYRMISFAQQLLTTRVHEWSDMVPAEMTFNEVSTLINRLKNAPVKGAAALPEPGVYVLEDGTLVKVKENKTKTNRYSLRWEVINGERLNELGDAHVHGQWVYAPELRSQCKEEKRMTVDQAKEFGLVFGQCCNCGRTLVASKSVLAAIGPVCIKKFKI